jgi:uncharacterized protein (UPF0333 family)
MATVTTASIITIIRGLIKDNLQTDGLQAHEYDNDASFLLEKPYVSSSTIKVYKNGSLLTLTTDYTYNSTTNKVTIVAALIKGDNIVIAYSYYERYSDTEITSFIKCNLVWFTKKRYKKHFYMNASDEVVALDGFNPTEEEGNIIALITAIDIDPKNINIRTKDFSISPVENKSRSEQIDEVFASFLRGFGSIGFLEEKEA